MGHPARLTSHLLARKGTAFPAGGFAAVNIAVAEPPPAAFSAAAGPRPLAPAGPVAAPQAREPAGRESRVKMTVRLDPGQHGRLRILAALQRCTSQEIIVRALDAYIRANGSDCVCLERPELPKGCD
jgi:hypothetical protein